MRVMVAVMLNVAVEVDVEHRNGEFRIAKVRRADVSPSVRDVEEALDADGALDQFDADCREAAQREGIDLTIEDEDDL